MPSKKAKIYKCSYCGRVFNNSAKADQCRNTHDLVYVEITKADLQNILQFIFTREDELLKPSLLKALRKPLYNRK